LWGLATSAKIPRGINREEGLTEGAADAFPGGGLRHWLLTWVVFAGVGVVVYLPALSGPLHGDDLLYLSHPYMQELTLPNALAIFDPNGEMIYATANYSPIQLLAHLLEVAAFGGYSDSLPFHVVNVLVHALNATLLVALVSSLSLPLSASLIVGAMFLVHPANVEAVAWISQLKTLLAFAFGIGALLLLRRRPAMATVAFALGLLSKPVAASVLPAAALSLWMGVPGQVGRARRAAWLGVWLLVFLLYAVPQLRAFQYGGQFRAVENPGTMAIAQQVVAIVARYAVLATTGLGSSISHEPEFPTSLMDPWWLGGIIVIAAVASVCVWALRRRHPAAPWLALAAAAYLPVAQLLPFRYPMADRYLYFVLAGLLAAAAVAAMPRLERALQAVRAGGLRAARGWLLVVAVGSVALCVVFAASAQRRAAAWGSVWTIALDAAQHYPKGTQAALLRAQSSMNRGDLDAAVDALWAARARGHLAMDTYESDPTYAPLRGHPRFMELALDVARWWVQHLEPLPKNNQPVLIGLARAYLLLGDFDRAEQAYERAAVTKGSMDPTEVRARLREARWVRSLLQE
jgi:hypothetical protein